LTVPQQDGCPSALDTSQIAAIFGLSLITTD
jgi:hypothetical protein